MLHLWHVWIRPDLELIENSETLLFWFPPEHIHYYYIILLYTLCVYYFNDVIGFKIYS